MPAFIVDRFGLPYAVARRGDVYTVTAGEALVARAALDVRKGSVAEVLVWPAFRRRGVASALYRVIEADLGKPLRPSRIRSKAGRAFWASRALRTNQRSVAGIIP